MKNYMMGFADMKSASAFAPRHTWAATLRRALTRCALTIALFALSAGLAAAQSLKVPDDIEYGDLSELGLPARIFVHSTPDAYSRVAIVKELERHPELVEVVGRVEDAQALLLYFGPGVEAGNSVLPAEGAGEINLSGTLVVFRMVEACNGGERPRQLFIDRKTKTVQARFALPLTGLNGFAEQGPAGPRPSGKALGVELVVRLGLFLMQKKFGAVNFDQSSATLALSFSQKAEKQTAKSLVDALKKTRKTRPYIGTSPVWPDPYVPAGSSLSSIYRAVPKPLPCPEKATRPQRVAVGEVLTFLAPETDVPLVTLEATPLIRSDINVRPGGKRKVRPNSQRGTRSNGRRGARARRRP